MADMGEMQALQIQVAKLRAQLEESRERFLELPPAKYRALLAAYESLQAPDNVHRWLEGVAEKIVATYMPPSGSPSAAMYKSEQRVLCPLCGEGGEHIYGEVGFMYPEGLRRHLTGEVTARLCPVMEATRDLAKSTIERKRRDHG